MKKHPDTQDHTPDESTNLLLSRKLLGSLECDVMECMWKVEEAPVQQVVTIINKKRPIAYTTIMTVMGHLVEKGLLTRVSEGKRYLYKVAQTKEEFLKSSSRNMVRRIINDFGDLAISGFMGEIGKARPEKLDELKKLLQEALNEDTQSE